MSNTELNYIRYCKQLIEEKLKWINSQDWKQRDYLNLIDLIENNNGISLSLSTIKRIWKQDSANIPQPATLDALARFLEYENWLHFKKSNQNVVLKKNRKFTSRLHGKRIVVSVVVFIVIVLTIVLFQKIKPFNMGNENIVFDADSVSFSCEYSASSGLPNTAIFNYDVSNVTADSFFIQQSWDELQRERVQKSDINHTSIYYYPGYHEAKLFANDSIIKRTEVKINTNNWLAMVRNGYMDQMPRYIRSKDVINNGELNINKTHLEVNRIDLNDITVVSYYYVTDFKNVSSSDFRFETRIKCDSIYNFTCPHITICILGENDMNFIPLTIKGCVGFTNVKMGNITKSGRNNDLSLLGVNIYEWQNMELQVSNNIADIILNGEQILNIPFETNIGNIVGFNFNFSGTGTVDNVRLFNKDNIAVYDYDF